jgi:hypothetical protein
MACSVQWNGSSHGEDRSPDHLHLNPCLKDGMDLSRVIDLNEKLSIKNFELGSCQSYLENLEKLLKPPL